MLTTLDRDRGRAEKGLDSSASIPLIFVLFGFYKKDLALGITRAVLQFVDQCQVRGETPQEESFLSTCTYTALSSWTRIRQKGKGRARREKRRRGSRREVWGGRVFWYVRSTESYGSLSVALAWAGKKTQTVLVGSCGLLTRLSRGSHGVLYPYASVCRYICICICSDRCMWSCQRGKAVVRTEKARKFSCLVLVSSVYVHACTCPEQGLHVDVDVSRYMYLCAGVRNLNV